MPDATPLFHRRWFQITLTIFTGFILVSLFVYVDVVSRARHAFLEGEKYRSWNEKPSLKQKVIQQDFEKRKQEIESKFLAKKLSDLAYKAEIQALEFDRDFQMNESSLKLAYAWYKDAYELFSPPESKWVKQARLKASETLELWKQELREKKIPFEETMVQ